MSAPARLVLTLEAPAVRALASAGALPALRDALADGALLRIARADAPGGAPAAFDLLDDAALAARTLTPEPLVIASFVASALPGVGVAADVDVLREHPYNLARRIGSLDHLTGGRAGVVVRPLAPGDDAARAAEALWLVQQLLQTWPLDSFAPDGSAPAIADVERIWAPRHEGRYRVAGPLTTPSSPQGLPVFVRAVDGAPDGETLHDLSIAEPAPADVLPEPPEGVLTAAWRVGDRLAAVELRPAHSDPLDALEAWRAARGVLAERATTTGGPAPTLRAALGLPARRLERPATAEPAFADATGKDLF